MRRSNILQANAIVLIFALLFVNLLPLSTSVFAADHAESTSVAADPAADIGDVYAFLDPTDNSKMILAMTVSGFLVPSEASNLGFFPSDILYRFELETTGDAVSDTVIDVAFSQQTSRSTAQLATVTIPTKSRGGRPGREFTAPTTVPTFGATSPPFVVTTDGETGVSFFAGLSDDPFYFDIVAFSRFTSSIAAGTPDPTRLQRGRDSFAGYNIHTIVLKVPLTLFRSPAGNVIGVQGLTLRQRNSTRQNTGVVLNSGDYVQVDRMGVPAVNTLLLPFARKNEYNASTPQDDANGLFASNIVGALVSLGTNQANINILASVAVANGDYLRLNLSTPNNNLGFGQRATTPAYTGFPNGRRFGDDVVDVLTYFVSNQALEFGDNVNANDAQLTGTFPFLGLPNQPLEAPTLDDRTRN
ncbi:MAG: DUF4331 family protein [Pyrinomonadaceae bacterium]